jgi:hypothetical protein
MKNIMRNQTTKDLRIQRNAVNAFQKTIEEFLVKNFWKLIHCIYYLIYSLMSLFNDEFINDSRQKNHDSDKKHAIVKQFTS